VVHLGVEGCRSHTTQFEEELALALQVASGDRLRLIERVVASVEHEIQVRRLARNTGAGTCSKCWMNWISQIGQTSIPMMQSSG
jgi:hypothetical protein